MATLSLRHVSKVYDKTVKAVQDFNLEIADREFIVLVGPSGCGKSTTLRMVAGLEEISGGEIYIGDRLVNKLPPKDRDISMVFQNYALYPHMTVADNIMFPLINRKVPKAEARERAQEMAKLVQLDHLMDRKPKALSGGQQQRVAIARALVKKPEVLLLDEPLSNLDAKLRVETREEIRRIQQEVGITTIFVTHDQEEAMSISDRIAVMEKGVVQQFEVPQKMYLNPGNLFVAQFLGTPQINIFDVTVKGGKIMCGDVVLREGCKAADGNYKAGVRPEAFNVSENGILVKATHVRMTGRELQLRVALAKEELRVLVHSDMQVSVGTEFCVTIRDNQILLFDQTGKTVGKY